MCYLHFLPTWLFESADRLWAPSYAGAEPFLLILPLHFSLDLRALGLEQAVEFYCYVYLLEQVVDTCTG